MSGYKTRNRKNTYSYHGNYDIKHRDSYQQYVERICDPTDKENSSMENEVSIADDVNMSELRSGQQYKFGKSWIIVSTITVLVILIFYFTSMPSNNVNIHSELEKLKAKYPNQKRTLWQNVRKIVDKSEFVHSLVLLYKGNSAVTAECFTKDLVNLIKKMHNIENTVIYKSKGDVEYGEELIRYVKLVKENKHMIVPKLQDMSGETARMFHTLCDSGHHSVKPSYIIFTLEDVSDNIDSGVERENPTVKVGNILRKLWHNLLENELHPLISRIVRNVEEISWVNVSC